MTGGKRRREPTDERSDRGPADRRSGRRGFLARAAAATGSVGALGALAGCGGFRSGDEEPAIPPDLRAPDGPFDSVPSPFDSVADLTDFGLDASGEGSLAAAIADAAVDGRLLYLPPGRYPLREALNLSDAGRFGLVGDDATVAVRPESSETLLFVESGDGDGSVFLDSLHFDVAADAVTSRVIDARAPDRLGIRDVSVAGRLDGGRGAVRVDVTDPNGSGVVSGLSLRDGAVTDSTATGCYVGDEHRGSIAFTDCRIEGFPDNGLYATPERGRVVVDGGYYANNGVSNVRVRNGSVVRGVRVRCDVGDRELENMRGIRLSNDAPTADAEPTVVEDVVVEMVDVTGSDGAITLAEEVAAAEIRDATVVVHADDVHALWAKTPHESLQTADATSLRCEGLTVTGDAGEGVAVQIDDRDGSVLTDVDVTQPGAERNGIEFKRSYDNTLRDARIAVGGEAIVLSEATVETRNVERDAPPEAE
ncbi:hypothetical protein [Halorubrum sp. Atlit-26R]|uniref:hypothetical protein n=1 Tax=Halorubrum sp. Atlit-26R TaxID=2282128 RepID=UPI000EF26BF4|nr:hypothetical protein [Halorubrum sp. Atlit-26R]RLM64198.1 hypothetical protein DVK07_14745 [Halorubrum sp. Atlit-26R]